MKRLMLPFVVFTLAACDGGGGSSPQAEDTAPVDVLDVIPMDTAPDIAPDVAPDIAPDTPPDIPEGCTPEEHDGGDGTCVPLGTCVDGFHDDGEGICVPEGDCAPGFVLGGDGVCVPEGTCSDGYHDGGEGICVPEGECAYGFSDGGDGSCVPEGSCAAGYHDGGDGACLPDGACIPGFFIDPESEDGACRAEIVISDPEVGGTQPMILWDGTGATAIARRGWVSASCSRSNKVAAASTRSPEGLRVLSPCTSPKPIIHSPGSGATASSRSGLDGA